MPNDQTDSPGTDAGGAGPEHHGRPDEGHSHDQAPTDDPKPPVHPSIELSAPPDGMVARLDRLAMLEVTPEREQFRRLASAARRMIEALTATDADAAQLSGAADQLIAVAELLEGHPKRRAYEGFAELANAGEMVSSDPQRLAQLASELYATFDHSPFIGLSNPLSPPVRLRFDRGRVVGEVTFGSAYEGPPGCVHGGYVAAVFDEMLGSAQALAGAQGMTAYLHVDYRSPTPLHKALALEAWPDRREGRKTWCRGTIHADGHLTAECEALFIAMDRGTFTRLLAERKAPAPT